MRSIRTTLAPVRSVAAQAAARFHRWRALPTYVELENGRRMFVDLGDRRGRKLSRRQGSIFPTATKMWERLANASDWDVVVDVGANYGEMVLALPDTCRATVIAIEPNPRVAAYLATSLEAARMDATLMMVAVADQEGYENFAVDLDSSGASALSGETTSHVRHRARLETVDCILEEAFGLTSLEDLTVLIKIDVEGAEARVLRGAAATISRCREVALMVESFRVPELHDLARSLGLSVAEVDEAGERFRAVADPGSPGEEAFTPWVLDQVLFKAELGGRLSDLLSG